MSNYLMSDNVVYANARMKANSTSAANVVSGVAIIFENEDYDSASAYDETTGQYTVPADGEYRVSFAVTPTSIGTDGYIANINVAGTNVVRRSYDFTQTTSQTIFHEGTVSATKGQIITVNVSGANFPTVKNGDSARNYLTIERVADYSAGQPVGFGVATADRYGLVQAPKYITEQSFTGFVGTTVYSQLTPDTITIGPGTYLIEYGARLRFVDNGSSPSSVEGVIGFGEDGGSVISSTPVGLAIYDGADWRAFSGGVREYTTSAPITLALFGRMINNGGNALTREASEGYLKVTKIS